MTPTPYCDQMNTLPHLPKLLSLASTMQPVGCSEKSTLPRKIIHLGRCTAMLTCTANVLMITDESQLISDAQVMDVITPHTEYGLLSTIKFIQQ